MKFSYSSKPEYNYLLNFARNIANDYFLHIKSAVLIFVSGKCDDIVMENGQNPKACYIPQVDYIETQKSFREFNELKDIDVGKKKVIWLGKSIIGLNENEWKKIICHELKHIEQRRTNPELFEANQIYELVLKTQDSPCNKDANNFANSIVTNTRHKQFIWEAEITKLIRREREKIIEEQKKIGNPEYIPDKFAEFILSKLTEEELSKI